jgi:flagellar biosynthesis/type III secretory pathway protein FliH
MAAMSGAALEKVMRECGFIEKWETEGMEKGLERGLQKGRQEAAVKYTAKIRRLEEEIRRLRKGR